MKNKTNHTQKNIFFLRISFLISFFIVTIFVISLAVNAENEEGQASLVTGSSKNRNENSQNGGMQLNSKNSSRDAFIPLFAPPQAPITIYFENFENRPTPVTSFQQLTAYTGAAAALNQTYTASTFWLNRAACNGGVLSQATASTYGGIGNCTSTVALGVIARAAGQFHGLSGTARDTESVLAAYTNASSTNNQIQFETNNLITFPGTNQRFITFGVDSIQTSCVGDRNELNQTYSGTLPASLNFYLVNSSGTETALNSTPINACASATPFKLTGGTQQDFRAVSIRTPPALFAGGSQYKLRMRNAQGSGAGNDGAIDNVILLDVTPTITKSFSPASAPVGTNSTLTFEITNTTDLLQKNGWSFTDSLPTGLVVAPTPGVTTTCGTGTTTTATAGSTSISVSGGNLIAGASSCTISVNVRSSTAGTYNNTTTNLTAFAGLNNNVNASVQFVNAPDLTIAKSHTPATFIKGSTGTYQLTIGNTGTAATSEAITVVDTLPTGLTVPNGAVTLSGAQAANWSCNSVSNVITCTSSTAIATSGSSIFSFTVSVATNVANSITNNVTVSGGGEYAVNNGNNSASDVTPTLGIPLLNISKTSNGPWTVGQTNSSYTLTVSNTGSVATSGTITVRDALPLGIGIRPASGFNPTTGWTCSYPFETSVGHNGVVTNSLITCTSSTSIAAGASVNLSIPVVATSLSPASVTNRVSVSGGGDSSFTDPSNYAGVTSCSNSTHCTSNTTTVTQLPAPPATCAVGSVRNLISTPLIGGHTQNGGAAIIANATLISGANNYSVGTGTGARFVVDMAWRWNNGVGDNSAASTLNLQVNGTTYATLTTFNQYPGYAVLTASNGASLPNEATTMEVYRYTFENMWVTLPASVTSINSANTRFVGGNDGGGDDFNYQINAINTCGATLGVTKSSNGPWAINQPSASYTLNVSNTGQPTFGTATVLDTLPTGITAKWTGTHSSGIWNCTFSGQIVTCSTTTVMSTGATNAITLPVNVTPSAPIGTNSITNYASIGGGGDPFNNGTTQTPGVACSDSVHCATNQTTINSNPPNIELVKSCPNPADCTSAPQLPGTELTYQINFANTGGLSAANLAIVDGVPANTDFKVGSAIVSVGSTGLTFVIEYSADYDPLNPNLATWGYTPVTGGGGAAAGYDRLVKAVRWRVTSGNLSSASPNNSGNVSFITKIR